MYKDEIEEYLKSSAVKTLRVPDHALITTIETQLDWKQRERFWMLCDYIFVVFRHSVSKRREVCGNKLEAYQSLIFSAVRTELVGNTYQKKIMGLLEAVGVVKIAQPSRYKHSLGINTPTVYALNEDVCRAPTKTVVLNGASAISAWTRFLRLRKAPFSRADRDVINKQHRHLTYAITGEQFARKHRKECRILAEQKARNEGETFQPAKWRAGFIQQCRLIDSFKTVPDRDKWILCTVDMFGKRLHHNLTSVPSLLRQYARLGELVPLFEIDLTASQPTLTCLNMLRDGVVDQAYIDDVKSGRLYEKYADRRKLDWSREKAKTMVFSALFGSANSNELKNLCKCYPQLAEYLRKVKSEERTAERKILSDYAPYKNNCISCQQTESLWAKAVWHELGRNGYSFLPVHDSVIVFGWSVTAASRIGEMENWVTWIMERNMRELWPEIDQYGLKPIFKITAYYDFEEFQQERVAN